MPLKPREMERLILADGWVFKSQEGSHRNYIHPIKPGKVTIPFHQGKDLSKKKQKIPSEGKRGLNSPIVYLYFFTREVYSYVVNVSSLLFSRK